MTVDQAEGLVVDAMRALGGDRRGVTTRDLCGRTGLDERTVRGGLGTARARGHIGILGRSPSGSTLYALAAGPDALDR